MEQNKISASVLMSVYSESPAMLREAVDSILAQTFRNFEFLLYLDKPDNDQLWALLQEYAAADNRIVIHRNEHNRHLAGTLNDEIAVAKGDYMIRMDGDDISTPDRFEKLVAYMEANPEIGVGSSWIRAFGSSKARDNRVVKYPDDELDMKIMMLYQTPIAHAPSIIRRSVVEQYAPLYNELCCCTQDYELWSRLMREGVHFGMVNEPLYLRRASHGDGVMTIPYPVIHNQISRRNIQDVLNNFGIKLNDNISADDILLISDTYKSCSDKQQRKKLAVILMMMYMTLYKTPSERIRKIISGDDMTMLLDILPKLAARAFLIKTNNVFDLTNICTDKSLSIY